jgi:hypothetical protein
MRMNVEHTPTMTRWSEVMLEEAPCLIPAGWEELRRWELETPTIDSAIPVR